MHSFTYVITGNGMKAMPVASELNLLELQELVRRQSKPIHPESTERVWSWGVVEFVNPQVHTLSDFGQRGPALIGV